MSKQTLFSLLLMVAFTSVDAQSTTVKIDSLLIGNWKGSSICQIKNSPCHDENVVYHISKKNGSDSFYVNAAKIVNGVEDGMGILSFVYSRKTNQIISTMHGIWTLNIEGTTLEGTLFVRGDLYRKIKIHKQY